MSAPASSFHRSYAPADGRYTARAAPLWRRGVAAALDWTLAGCLYLLLLIPAGMLEIIGDLVGGAARTALVTLGQAAALGGLFAYFTFFLRSGHTLGMRALDIHVRAHESGDAPSVARSLPRAVLGLVFATATVTAYAYVQGTPVAGEFTPGEREIGTIAVAVATAALLGQLWKLVDPEGRTAWDRLAGLVVVEDIVLATMPDRLWTPWGT